MFPISTKVGKDHSRLSQPTFPAQSRITCNRLLRTMASWVLNISKDEDSTASVGNLYQHLTILTVYFCLTRISLISFCANGLCPVTGHYWEESGSLFFPLTSHIYTLIRSISAFSSLRLSNPVSLSPSSYDSCSCFLIIFVALCCTHFSRSMSLLYQTVQSWVQHSKCVSLVLRRGKGMRFLTFWQHSA